MSSKNDEQNSPPTLKDDLLYLGDQVIQGAKKGYDIAGVGGALVGGVLGMVHADKKHKYGLEDTRKRKYL